ncbi:MAG: hypothetical protein Kow0059_13640 [Candidatus Sumerlaeia bacterium]
MSRIAVAGSGQAPGATCGRLLRNGVLVPAVLLIPSVLLLAVLFPQPLVRAGRALAYPFQLDGEEGFLLDQALQLAAGRSIYGPIGVEPYLVGNYPPLYPALWGLIQSAAGGRPSLIWGRLIVLAGFAVVAALTVMMTWRAAGAAEVGTRADGGAACGVGRLVAALLPVLYFSVTYDWFDWIAYARVDIPAIAFSMGALAVVALSPPERLGGRVFWAAGLAVAALFTKQTMLAAPAAIAVWLLVFERRHLRRFALAVAVPGAALFLLFTLLTGGEFFRHLIVYNANRFAWFQVAASLRHLWFFQKFALTAAVAGGVLALWAVVPAGGVGGACRSAVRHLALCGLYCALACGNLWAVGKEGSAPNYLLEVHLGTGLVLGAGLVAGLAAARGADRAPRRLRGFVAAAVIAAGLLAHAVGLHRPVQRGGEGPAVRKFDLLFSRPTPGPADTRSEERLVAALPLDAPGGVLAEYPIYGILSGRRPVLQPFIMSQLAREGRWDPLPLVREIRAGRFAHLLTTQDVRQDQAFYRWGPEFIAAFRESFALRRVIPRLGGREHLFWYDYRGPTLTPSSTPPRPGGSGPVDADAAPGVN